MANQFLYVTLRKILNYMLEILRRVFGIFKIKREERWLSLLMFLYVTILNGLVIWKYYDRFSVVSENYRRLFVKFFRISGFDPLTYSVVSNWATDYNIYRHPLLAFFMAIPNAINYGLMKLLGVNPVQFTVAAILIFCAFYSFIFIFRIFREIICLDRMDAALLSALNFSFAYVMISISVPDHFSISMFMLILTLYVAGRKMKSGRPFTKWQTILFFFLTAGISLNNGVKTFLANLFVNGRKFWKPSNLVFAVIVPSAIIWGTAKLEWYNFEYPNFHARQMKKLKKASRDSTKVIKMFNDTATATDSAVRKAQLAEIFHKKAEAKKKREAKKVWKKHTGKPFANGEFSQWTDKTTNRVESIVENLFGESLILHKEHLLQDVLKKRPVIVKYGNHVNYIVESIIVLMFICGIWCGRRSRFMWLAMAFWGFDMFIHVVLGFGINEVYIMTAHWAFVIPIVMGHIASVVKDNVKFVFRISVAVVVVYLFVRNVSLYAGYLIG